jgi:hypothetical protein
MRVKQLRQGLVDGIQGDVAGNAGVNVDIDLGIAGQGKSRSRTGTLLTTTL